MVAVGTNKAGVENTTSDTIDATDNHPFWVQSRGEWVDAIELQPGDVLLDEQGNDILVTELAVTEQDLTAYNLTIEDIHTYYAGDQPTLVHNCGDSPPVGSAVYLAPGPYAGRSIEGDATRRFNVQKRRDINEIMAETGCHTCGTKDPGTKSGNAIPDHQPALSLSTGPYRLYPQCQSCSSRQGLTLAYRAKWGDKG